MPKNYKTQKHGPGRTQQQHSFATIPSVEMERSVFNRNCGTKTTFDSGDLVPIFVDEALPGDTFSMNATVFSRIATLLRPIMDNVYLDVFFFAVPMRILWDNWEKFNGAQDDPDDSTTFQIPTITTPTGGGYAEMDLGDYLGLPTHIGEMIHSAMFQRAYYTIWNEWFRDENLQDSHPVSTGDGPDTFLDELQVMKRGKRHDYFTSCLPWPQKGDAITLPIGSSAPLSGLIDATEKGTTPPSWKGTTSGTSIEMTGSGSTLNSWSSGLSGDARWDNPSLEVDLSGGTADLSGATASTINAIRQAFQLQRLAERDARGGTRYTEILRSHFGVISPDARLQRPEYLGGGTAPVMLTPVAQTGGAPQAQLSAFGVGANGGIGFTKSFTEHCIVIGLVASRADLNYQQGLERMFSRSTRFDFYWPALAHIGEQAVLNQELRAYDDDLPKGLLTFGYQERWAEYRYKPSKITGLFRSNATGTLHLWHLAQSFIDATTSLNDAFIQEDPPFSRIVAVTQEPDFLFDAFFEYKCARPMPTYSVPGMVDHF